MSYLIDWLNSPGVSDLGENAQILLELVQTKKNSRFMDIGVRGGASSAILSYKSKENNNVVCGCDLNFNPFFSRGRNYVDDDYKCISRDWGLDYDKIIYEPVITV